MILCMTSTCISSVLVAVFILLTLTLFANTSVQGQTDQRQQQQSPPIANAGPPVVNEGDRVTLTGTSSSDSDGKIVSYTWGIEDSDDESPPLLIEGQNTPIATFYAPSVVGDVDSNSYLFELTVTDNEGLTGSNTSEVVVTKK